MLMTHQLPFGYFKDFINEKKPDDLVYLNLYILIELYYRRLNFLVKQGKVIYDKKGRFNFKRDEDIDH